MCHLHNYSACECSKPHRGKFCHFQKLLKGLLVDHLTWLKKNLQLGYQGLEMCNHKTLNCLLTLWHRCVDWTLNLDFVSGDRLKDLLSTCFCQGVHCLHSKEHRQCYKFLILLKWNVHLALCHNRLFDYWCNKICFSCLIQQLFS